MKQQEEVREYLERYRGKCGGDSLIIRAGNALLRYDCDTMAQVAALSDEKIGKMRNVGVKTKAFIRRAAEDYRREQADTMEHLARPAAWEHRSRRAGEAAAPAGGEVK